METYQYRLIRKDGWLFDYLLTGATLNDIMKLKNELEQDPEFKNYLKTSLSFSIVPIETDEAKLKIIKNKQLQDNVNSFVDQCLYKCFTENEIYRALLRWTGMTRKEIAIYFKPDCMKVDKKPTSTTNDYFTKMHLKWGVHSDEQLMKKLCKYIKE